MRAIVKKLMAIYNAKLRAMEVYKAFETLKAKIIKGLALDITMGFDLCKALVA